MWRKPATASVRTPEEAGEWLRANGLSVTEFCRIHNLDRSIVFDLLRGKLKGHRGQAHDAAVLLGMKQGNPPRPPVEEKPSHAALMAGIEMAKAAILELEALGVDVLGLDSVLPPLIAVRKSPAVESLGGMPSMALREGAIARRVYLAHFKGCLVRWISSEPADRDPLQPMEPLGWLGTADAES
jgi:gp16 family phage-associated protein